MKYTKFKIKNYRAITEEIEIDLKKFPLLPIIGVNECGKTTILQALFSFDFFNDKLNSGTHLENVQNLYSDSDKAPMVTAEIEVENGEFVELLQSLKTQKEFLEYDTKIDEYLKIDLGNSIEIVRNHYTHSYSIKNEELKERKFNNLLAKEIVSRLPYILYFDDFRDSIMDKIEIKEGQSGWTAIIEELFKRTNPDYSIFKLQDLEARRRKSIIGKVQDHLNNTLTKEWQSFRLDDKDALTIEIEFDQVIDNGVEKSFIKLEVNEKDEDGVAHYFYIKDRSKGFYWFFNFVMKTEFNPKVVDWSKDGTIYLLDEPGSYLHANAQVKLCKKLNSLSKDNKVIYCTHSHYLLNPEIIPINSVRIAEKLGNGSVKINTIHQYTGKINHGRNAFQPILDALEIKPLPFDLGSDTLLLTEGIYDYYALSIFKGDKEINILPCTGADSIKFYISMMIAWQKKYYALWDNDNKGRNAYSDAKKYFGEVEAEKSFRLLTKREKSDKIILQDLIDGDDYLLIREKLEIIGKSSFEKTMLTLYYSENRSQIVNDISEITKSNFASLFKLFK